MKKVGFALSKCNFSIYVLCFLEDIWYGFMIIVIRYTNKPHL